MSIYHKTTDRTYRITDAGIRSEVIVGRYIPHNAPPATRVFLDGRHASSTFEEVWLPETQDDEPGYMFCDDHQLEAEVFRVAEGER